MLTNNLFFNFQVLLDSLYHHPVLHVVQTIQLATMEMYFFHMPVHQEQQQYPDTIQMNMLDHELTDQTEIVEFV